MSDNQSAPFHVRKTVPTLNPPAITWSMRPISHVSAIVTRSIPGGVDVRLLAGPVEKQDGNNAKLTTTPVLVAVHNSQLAVSSLRSLRISVISALTKIARIFNAEITEIRRDRREESNREVNRAIASGTMRCRPLHPRLCLRLLRRLTDT